jgi:hypothetical protein
VFTFLFWNLGGQVATTTRGGRKEREVRLSTIVANLAEQHSVDLLILAECPVEAKDLLRQVNKRIATEKLRFRQPDPTSLCERILIFPRFPAQFLKPKSESNKYSGRIIELPARPPIILFACHFAGKTHRSDQSQAMSVPAISGIIRMLEQEVGHQRTLLVGDLNMNPFEQGIVAAEGLNAVMTRELALRRERTVDGVRYPFFYNPMWSYFGDSTHELHPPGTPQHEPPGSCYYSASESIWYYWNIFDQVMLRPDLTSYFRNQDLKLLVTDGTTSLITEKGMPDRDAVSDHLPLLFRLSI